MHLEQHDADEREIDRLLADGQPGVDAAEREDVEEEAGDEEHNREAPLVARGVELDPLEGAGRCARRFAGCNRCRSLSAHRMSLLLCDVLCDARNSTPIHGAPQRIKSRARLTSWTARA